MPQQTPPAPPTPPKVVIDPAGKIAVFDGSESPLAVYRAKVAQRSELVDQRNTLQEERSRLSDQLQDPMVQGVNRTGIEARVARMDAQIEAVDARIAAANAEVAQAAAVPGAVVEMPPFERGGPPEEFYVLSGLFLLVAVLPISLAYARRIWRRGASAMSALPGDLMDRLARLDQAVDSIAVEVERIGEGQRFVTRVLGERAAVPVQALDAGAASPSRGAFGEKGRG